MVVLGFFVPGIDSAAWNESNTLMRAVVNGAGGVERERRGRRIHLLQGVAKLGRRSGSALQRS